MAASLAPGCQGELAPATAEVASAIAGSWTALANPLPAPSLSNPILLTDGSVIAHVSCKSEWYRLTPSSTGSYVHGTWSAIASTTSGYAPRFFGSGVLPDGRVVIEGGEYNGAGCPQGSRTSQGAVYDPAANTWTPIAPPAGWGTISDASGIVLPSGSYLQTSCCDAPAHAALLNPATLTWTATGTGKLGIYDEESMALLHDGTVLTVDAYVGTGTCGTGSERYTPATGAWTSAGSTVVQQADCNGNGSFEVGPLVMRPDGTAVSFSGRTTGTPQTAIYNTTTGTWAAGPAHPVLNGVPYTMADAPAAVLPSGAVLVAMSPGNWPNGFAFPAPTHYWELNADNTFTAAPDRGDAATFNSFDQNLLLLPTGQVMAFTIDGPAVDIYTPAGAPLAAWRPTISSAPTSLAPGQTYALSGTQLNGLHEGTYYGDDTNASTNFPLLRLTYGATGHVVYVRTFNHSSRSIAPGAASTFNFTVPTTIELGAATLEVVANGIASAGLGVTVGAVPAELTSPAAGSTIAGAATFAWTTGAGVAQYYLYVGSSVGAADLYAASQGTATSVTVGGLPTDGRTLFVRLWSLIGGGWQFRDYTFSTLIAVPASLYSPTPGSLLPGPTATFAWTTGAGVSLYYLYVGTTPGGFDLYAASQGLSTAATIGGLPTDGRLLYVRLWSYTALGWLFRDYSYVAAGQAPAEIYSPAPGSTLAGASATFAWTTGSGVSLYYLYLGSSPGGADLYAASQGLSTSVTIGGLPTDGRLLYARLWSLIGSSWQLRDYTYTAAVQGTPAQIWSPGGGSRLPGASATFWWTTGVGASMYYLYVGSAPGGADLYAAAQGLSTVATAGGLPMDGRVIYVRLWTLLATGWDFRDTTYLAASAGVIGVASASYGTAACGVAAGGVTGSVAAQCNGQTACSIFVDNTVFGDPAPGCAKDFSVTWDCGAGTAPRTATHDAVVNEGYTVTISCP